MARKKKTEWRRDTSYRIRQLSQTNCKKAHRKQNESNEIMKKKQIHKKLKEKQLEKKDSVELKCIKNK